MKALKKELKLKDGTVFSKGTVLENVTFSETQMLVLVTIGSRVVKIGTTRASKYVPGITACPTVRTLEKWMDEGFSRTITGKKVEPDGVAADGSKSWNLVLALI